MNNPATVSLETILRQCAAAAPLPWYPKLYSQSQNLHRDDLDPPLEKLRLAGLIVLTDWVQEFGQGYVLTPAGEEILARPGDLVHLGQRPLRLRALPVDDLADGRDLRGDRAGLIRDSLLSTSPTVFTIAILVINIAVFVYGIYLAKQLQRPMPSYFSSDGEILRRTGSLHAVDILQGAWWRLLSCCFVHIGWVHLGVNMYTLYVLGPLSERMWGRFRYLILYLVAGFGGSCVAIVYNPASLAGASGALWGIMIAMMVWMYLNRDYLPRQFYSDWQGTLIQALVMNIAISLWPGTSISAAAHFGGGGVGLVFAFLLHWQRYGGSVLRFVSLLGILAVPILCAGSVVLAPSYRPEWKNLVQHGEAVSFKREVLDPVNKLDLKAKEIYETKVLPLVETPKNRQEQAAVNTALDELANAQQVLKEGDDLLQRAGPYVTQKVENVRLARKEYLVERIGFFQIVERKLRAGKEWTEKDEEAWSAQVEKLEEARKRWRSFLE